jgi:hypothetical protein
VCPWYDTDFEQLMTINWSSLLKDFLQEYLEASGLDFSDFAYSEKDLLQRFHADFLERFIQRYVQSSRGQLYHLLVQPEPDPEARVVERLKQWRQARPERVAANEVVRAGQGLFSVAAFALGFSLRWQVRGDSCSFCRLLSGRVIRKGQYFKEAGDSLQPKGKQAMKIRGNVGHPPVHRRCRCYLTSVRE